MNDFLPNVLQRQLNSFRILKRKISSKHLLKMSCAKFYYITKPSCSIRRHRSEEIVSARAQPDSVLQDDILTPRAHREVLTKRWRCPKSNGTEGKKE